jgi:hypothetical protein
MAPVALAEKAALGHQKCVGPRALVSSVCRTCVDARRRPLQLPTVRFHHAGDQAILATPVRNCAPQLPALPRG